MILRGPNKDSDPWSYQAEMDFEDHGSEKCMLEFFTHKPDEMYTVILLKSGTLKLNGCTISLDGIFLDLALAFCIQWHCQTSAGPKPLPLVAVARIPHTDA